MYDYSWPGNIRELRNLVRRACVNSADGTVTAELMEIPRQVDRVHGKCGTLLEESAVAARDRERQLIRKALETSGGNRTKAAEILGVSYRTLLTKLKEIDV
jgi:DNA-binding NtrC family response regulator